MIKTVNLQKVYTTEEVETTALNNVNIDIEEIVMVTHNSHDAGYAHRIIHLFDGHVATENIAEKRDSQRHKNDAMTTVVTPNTSSQRDKREMVGVGDEIRM